MEQFKAWEDMSELEQCRETYWDMYKDAYGFRPRGVDTSSWTVEDFLYQFQDLELVIQERIGEERDAQAAAALRFEDRVLQVIGMGAGDRETALRWIDEADGSYGDMEFLCFLNGLPYGYFKKTA